METRYLKTLIVAAETGSFSRTAEVLNLTQSAVSQRVKFVEERYGHQLLDRSGQVLTPTEVGQMVLGKAREVLEKENELLDGLRRFNGEKRLSLCCTPTFGTAYLPDILNEFMMQNADLADLKFIFHQPEVALRKLEKGEFDLAVVEHCSDFDLTPFKTYQLPRDELVFIAAAREGRNDAPVPLDELLPQRLFARKDGCSSKHLLERNLAEHGRTIQDFRGVVISDDLRLNIQNVLAGSGISFLSRSLVADLLDQGALTAFHVRGFNHYRCRTVAVQPSRSEDPVIKRFLDCLFAEFGQESFRQQSCGLAQ